VGVTDNKVSPVTYVSGDNGDSVLQPGETWIYTGTTTLDATTTNAAIATGLAANGTPATDVASDTVIVGSVGGGGGPQTIIPPLINVVKIPDPLVLPAAGGSVTYTYIVTNPGTVALSNVSVTDNKVSPVTYVSGDSNGDKLLQPSETWVYTATTTLDATTTDTATATGSANGLTATDVATATVPVGVTANASTYPPLVDVVKIPDPLALTAGPGPVTYTYTVTNPGLVALSNVSVTDNKVSPVTYVSGDSNGDGLLQPGETWIYTGTTTLDATTTDTATATGSANGLTATHIASATVVVTPTGSGGTAGTPTGSGGTAGTPTGSGGTAGTPTGSGGTAGTPTGSGGTAITPTVLGGKIVPRTVTGGQIPRTSTPFSTPMYVLLLIGAALTLVGAVGWRNRKRYE
jgi:uncharacterized repeat protein (TIGR01451 family)